MKKDRIKCFKAKACYENLYRLVEYLRAILCQLVPAAMDVKWNVTTLICGQSNLSLCGALYCPCFGEKDGGNKGICVRLLIDFIVYAIKVSANFGS